MATNSITASKILITGARGFIGSHLCRRLLQDNSEVHGISRSPQAPAKAGIRWWQGDVADFGTIRTIVSSVKPAYIFHLASEVTGTRSLEAVLPTFRSNLASTVNVLTLAAEFGCHRIVLTGSLEEPEGLDIAPCSPYAAAKSASYSYARMFHALYQLPVVMARVFMAYGPDQRDSRKLIPYVTRALLRGEVPQLSSGLRPIDWVYVDDVVDGLLAAASVSGVEGATVELGSGTLVTIRVVVETLAELMHSSVLPAFGVLPDRPMERVRAAQAALTHRQLAWKAKTSLNDGLRTTIEWYRTRLDMCQLPRLGWH